MATLLPMAHYPQHHERDELDCPHCVLKLNQRIDDVFSEIAGVSWVLGGDKDHMWPQSFLGRQYKFGGEGYGLICQHGFASFINTTEFHMGMPVKLWRIAGMLGFVTEMDRTFACSRLRTLGKLNVTYFCETNASIALQFSVETLQ